MNSIFTNYSGNQVLQYFFTYAQTWAALFTDDPGDAGNLGVEVTGGGYLRQPTSWSTPGSKTMATINGQTWTNLIAGTVTHLGICDSLSAGHLLIRMELPTPVSITASGNFIAKAGDIAFTI